MSQHVTTPVRSHLTTEHHNILQAEALAKITPVFGELHELVIAVQAICYTDDPEFIKKYGHRCILPMHATTLGDFLEELEEYLGDEEGGA